MHSRNFRSKLEASAPGHHDAKQEYRQRVPAHTQEEKEEFVKQTCFAFQLCGKIKSNIKGNFLHLLNKHTLPCYDIVEVVVSELCVEKELLRELWLSYIYIYIVQKKNSVLQRTSYMLSGFWSHLHVILDQQWLVAERAPKQAPSCWSLANTIHHSWHHFLAKRSLPI